MNILLINDYLGGGGAEAVFRDQSEILKVDYRVDLFFAFNTIPDRNYSPFSYLYSFHFKKKLETFLQNKGYDFIIIHNYNGALSPSVLDVLNTYKKKRKCKIIHYAHDYHLICPNRGYSYFKNGQTINFQKPPGLWSILTKKLDYRGSSYSILKKSQWIPAYKIRKRQNVFDLVLTPSHFLAHQILLLYPKLNVKQIYNACDALGSTQSEKKKSEGKTIRLVYFGRLAQEKGLVNFIKGLKSAAIEYSFTMIGAGEEETTILNLIEQNKLQDKIFLKPQMSHEDLFEDLRNYDVFVLPSLWYENAPLSIIEAASIGLGLFLCGHGGVLEMGEICNAKHFFNPFDQADIRVKLETLYADFLSGCLPKSDKARLQALFSKKTYIENLKNYLTDNKTE
jgi:glycosyltransferase involved in cell wall biosynthesis